MISLFPFFFDFVWMSILWKGRRSAENKYSLIEYVSPHSHCSSFVLTCALIPTQSSPRLLQHNRYHLTYMGRDVFLSLPPTLVPCLSLSYKSSFSVLYPSQSSLLFHGLVAGCQPVRKMRLQSIRASQGAL